MNRTAASVPVRKSSVVRATPARALDAFSVRTDRWWPKPHGIGVTPALLALFARDAAWDA